MYIYMYIYIYICIYIYIHMYICGRNIWCYRYGWFSSFRPTAVWYPVDATLFMGRVDMAQISNSPMWVNGATRSGNKIETSSTALSVLLSSYLFSLLFSLFKHKSMVKSVKDSLFRRCHRPPGQVGDIMTPLEDVGRPQSSTGSDRFFCGEEIEIWQNAQRMFNLCGSSYKWCMVNYMYGWLLTIDDPLWMYSLFVDKLYMVNIWCMDHLWIFYG